MGRDGRCRTSNVPTEPLARAHHYVPQCWLAGFTQTGQKSGRLWVTDLKRRKQWPSSPLNAGHQRDFYRISNPQLEPLAIEKKLSEIESDVAPVLKALDEELRHPTHEELEALLVFMAIQWVRVPAFRPTVLAIADSHFHSVFSKALKSPESWAAMLKDAGISVDSPGADYEKAREFVRSKKYSLSAETEWFLLRGFKAAETIVPSLRARRWGTSFSKKGNFIGSDNPVALDAAQGSPGRLQECGGGDVSREHARLVIRNKNRREAPNWDSNVHSA